MGSAKTPIMATSSRMEWQRLTHSWGWGELVTRLRMLSREISESADVTHPGLSDMSRDMAGQESRAPVTRLGVVTAIVTSISSIV